MSNNQTFISHLEELRLRIIYSLVAISIASIICFLFHREILDLLKIPFENELVFISVHEVFLVSLKVSVLAGIITSSPCVLYNLWRFIESALKREEKNFIMKYVPLSMVLFAAGAVFAFIVVLPVSLKFFVNFAGDTVKPMISIDKYVSFVILLILIFSSTFQLPLIMRMLTKLRIVTKNDLKLYRKHAIVAIFITAALMTPPDVFTQIALALPVVLLYELGLVFSAGKKKPKG
ncbi:twin-arginine translocase subunit TatC [Elusimicrobiota bacterium]